MSIIITDSFGVNTTKPIDDRITAADLTARNAIAAGRRYQGMQCYVVSDTKTYVLKSGITNSDWLELGSVAVSNVITDTFNGTGAQTAFTLTSDPGSINNTQVFVEGVYQAKSTYSLSTTTLTFSEAPPTGTGNIQVNYGSAYVAGVPSDGSVTDVKISTAAVTTTKIADANVTTAKVADGAITNAKLAALNYGSAAMSPTSYTLTVTQTDVPGLSVTITTTGRPVLVFLQCNDTTTNGGVGSSSDYVMFVKRGGTNIGRLNNGGSGSYEVKNNMFLDMSAPAGSNTYTLSAASTTGDMRRFTLIAIEL